MPAKKVAEKEVGKIKKPSTKIEKEKLIRAIIYLNKGKWGIELYVKEGKPELYNINGEQIGKREEDGTITLRKDFIDKIKENENYELLSIDENIEAGIIHVENPKKKSETIKREKDKKPEVNDKEKLEEDMGLQKGDVIACTKVEDTEEFCNIVPSAREYTTIQLAHTKNGEIAFYGLNLDGKYELVKGTNIAQSTTKTVNKIDRDNKSIQEEAITGLITLNGENHNEYAFSVNYDFHDLELNLIRLQREANTYKIGFAQEIETDMQRPSHREMDEVMKEEYNPYIDDEIDREQKASKIKENVELNDVTEKTNFDETMIKSSILMDTMEQIKGKKIGLSEVRGFIRGQVIARMGAGYERIEALTSEIKEEIDRKIGDEEEDFIPPSYRKERNL